MIKTPNKRENKKNMKKLDDLIIALRSFNIHSEENLIPLIKKVKDINQKNKYGETPLMVALEKRFDKYSKNIISKLINEKTDLNQINDLSETPLMIIIKYYHNLDENELGILDLFKSKKNRIKLNHKDDNGDSILMIALKKKYDEYYIDYFLINEKTDFEEINSDGNTPFMLALENRYSQEIFKLLTDNKINFNKKELEALEYCFDDYYF